MNVMGSFGDKLYSYCVMWQIVENCNETNSYVRKDKMGKNYQDTHSLEKLQTLGLLNYLKYN